MAANTLDWVGHSLASGRYRITALLGEGGMGAVYKAHDANLDSEVVVKVPKPGLVSDHEFTARFAREVRSLVRLAHAHIVRVLDVGEHEGLPFAVMQYLNGGSLRDHLSALPGGPAALADLPSWLPGVADALDYIHLQGYVHRDVKPDNVLFDAAGHVYLGDFGIAKALAASESNAGPDATFKTSAGLVVGTPQYMAPELITAQGCDGRVDQYALAVTVYEAVCAQVPFDGPTPAALVVLHATKPPRPPHEVAPGIPLSFSMAMLRGLAKDPKQRYRDCRSLAQALVAALPTAGQIPYDLAPPASFEEAKERFTCPHCSLAFRLPPEKRGKVGRCPRCQQKFIVGAAAETPAGGLAPTPLATPAVAPLAAAPPTRTPVATVPASQRATESPGHSIRPLTVLPADPPRRQARWLLGIVVLLLLVLLGIGWIVGLRNAYFGDKGEKKVQIEAPGSTPQHGEIGGRSSGGGSKVGVPTSAALRPEVKKDSEPSRSAPDLPFDQFLHQLATRTELDTPENWQRLQEITKVMAGRAGKIANRSWTLPPLDFVTLRTSRNPQEVWSGRKVCIDGLAEHRTSLRNCLLVSSRPVQGFTGVHDSIVFINGDLKKCTSIKNSFVFCNGNIGSVTSINRSIILATGDLLAATSLQDSFFEVQEIKGHPVGHGNVCLSVLNVERWNEKWRGREAGSFTFVKSDKGPLQAVTFLGPPGTFPGRRTGPNR